MSDAILRNLPRLAPSTVRRAALRRACGLWRPCSVVNSLVLQRHGVMFEALSLVVASSGSGSVDSAPV